MNIGWRVLRGYRKDRDVGMGPLTVRDLAIDESEESVVSTNTYVFSGMPLGSALADEDASCGDKFAGCRLNA
jgi:hypothetical protein